MACVICCDTRLTSSNTVSCAACDLKCCKKCVKRHLTDTMDDAHCMKCRRTMTYSELVEQLPRTFIAKDFKRHRENILCDRQKAMIPATQNAVENERQRRQSKKRIRAWNEERDALRRRIRYLTLQISDEYDSMSKKPTSTPRQFIMKCSREGCRGFLSEQYKCSVCEGTTCRHCYVFLQPDTPHQCKEEDVATISLLRRDSKRCPKCATFIHRVDGCAQMFCTNCHCLFDYHTLRILGERDHVHNPHYTEWLSQQRADRQVGREAGDIPCGGMPYATELYRSLVHSLALEPIVMPRLYLNPRAARLNAPLTPTTPLKRCVMSTHRIVTHIEQETMVRYRPRVDDAELEALRVQFCLGDFDETVWRTRLQRHEKVRNKKHEVYLILEMVVHACSDLFRQMVLLGNSVNLHEGTSLIEALHNSVLSVLRHANAALCKASLTFGCTVPFFRMDADEHDVIFIRHREARSRIDCAQTLSALATP